MKKFLIIGGVIVVIIIIAAVAFRGEEEGPDFVIAKRGNIVQEVNVTGKVKAANDIDLAFEQSGRVGSVGVGVNNRVSRGQALVELVNIDFRADLTKAEADQAKQEAELVKTQIALDNYYDDVLPILRDAYTKSSDAVRKQLDELFTDDERENVSLTFLTSNTQFELDAESRRRDLTGQLTTWQTELDALGSTSDNTALETAIESARDHLNSVSAFLDASLNTVLESVSLTQATITTYKGNITTAQNNVNTVRADVRDIDQNISAQKAALVVQEAVIKSSEAAMKTAEAKLAKTVLRAPFNGTVVKQEADVGEIVAANEVVVSLISAGVFEIESFVPEVDIANLKVSDPASITLDAYGNDVVFEASVVSVDPAETVIEGVSTYKTILQFTAADERIKPGMTANIDILTNERKDVLIIPQRAVIRENGSAKVRVLDDLGSFEEVVVETGIRGSEGSIEILSGLNEGDKVITFLREE